MSIPFPLPRFLLTLGLLAIVLAGCAPGASTPAPVDANMIMTQVAATISVQLTQTALYTPPPTETPVPTATIPRTPPALPGAYTTTLLNAKDSPHPYISDACQYIRAKWDSNNAAPGTVVMTIMFHSITKGEVTAPDQISKEDFKRIMRDLHEMGFQAINMQQMVDFMYTNAKIPPRSVLLIVDDRKYREYFDTTFRESARDWNWPVVNAWISHPDTAQSLWDENAALESEGWVDHQAHGVIHNVNMNDNSTDEFLKGELQGSIDAMQAHFDKTPTAIIWPGGGFGLRPVQAARQYGFKLGFTINPRGPVMFNWVPLSDTDDPMRPSYIPEGSIGDPLMVLPRYWDTDVRAHMDTVRIIGQEATEYAQANKATELEYYDIMCAPTYGPIP